MLSLLILALLLVVLDIALPAWVIALVARAVGSTRGRFGVALAAACIVLFVNAALACVALALPPVTGLITVAAALLILLAQLCTIFFTMRAAFALSIGRSFAPFGAYIALILVQLAIVLGVVRPFLTSSCNLVSKCMSPTIEPGDRFLVNMLIQPRRFDIVVYRAVGPRPMDLCQRVVGLPGERLRFEKGELFVNDQRIDLPQVLNGRCHASPAGTPPVMVRYRDGETIALGADEMFVIGDNVDVSRDSRLVGPSPASSVIGVVDLLYWPFGRAHILR